MLMRLDRYFVEALNAKGLSLTFHEVATLYAESRVKRQEAIDAGEHHRPRFQLVKISDETPMKGELPEGSSEGEGGEP